MTNSMKRSRLPASFSGRTHTTIIQPAIQETPPAAVLQRLIIGDWISQTVQVAAKLGLADLLAAGPRTSDDLAQAVGAHAPSLFRLLRALASVGVFVEIEPRLFALTAVGNFLRRGVPGSLRARAAIHADIDWTALGHLHHSVMTGETAFQHVHGTGYFDYLEKDSAKGRLFDESMTDYVTMHGLAVARAYDFRPYSRIVDVGGGHGALVTEILKTNPAAQGVVFDLPDVIERAGNRVERAPGRCEFVGGSFFDSVPAGGDLYILTSIIHDWDDEHCHLILRNCRRAMSKKAKLLLVEMVVPPGNSPSFAKLLDIKMLACFGGRERTGTEYRELLTANGFRVSGILPTSTPASIIECEPV